jgi:hypothetical protein
MNKLIKEKTEKDKDLLADEASVIEYARALNHVAAVATSVHASYWSRPKERLLDVLNDDVAVTLSRFSANTAIGQAINSSLDALDAKDDSGNPLFTNRCPVSLGRDDITFDTETNLFKFITPA